MKTNKKFHWSEETLNHFEFQSSYDSRAKVLQDIQALSDAGDAQST